MSRTTLLEVLYRTPRELIAQATQRFKVAKLSYGHGTLNASDEAAWLMMHAMQCPFEDLESLLDEPLKAVVIRRALALFDRRIEERRPAAYLTQEAWLGAYRFYVDERVIVPRSYLAELLAQKLRPWVKPRQQIRSILDLCTGSGCLAIVAAHTFPKAQVSASDLSPAALKVAQRNVREHQLNTKLNLYLSDLFNKIPNQQFDLILTNPPYVREAVMRRLPHEYQQEPSMSLHGGADGFDLVRRILIEAASYLSPQGWLMMEVGHQRNQLERAFPKLPFIWAQTSGGDDCVLLLQRATLIAYEQQAHWSKTSKSQRQLRPAP